MSGIKKYFYFEKKKLFIVISFILTFYNKPGTGTLMNFTVPVPVRFPEKLKFRFQFLFGS